MRHSGREEVPGPASCRPKRGEKQLGFHAVIALGYDESAKRVLVPQLLGGGLGAQRLTHTTFHEFPYRLISTTTSRTISGRLAVLKCVDMPAHRRMVKRLWNRTRLQQAAGIANAMSLSPLQHSAARVGFNVNALRLWRATPGPTASCGRAARNGCKRKNSKFGTGKVDEFFRAANR